MRLVCHRMSDPSDTPTFKQTIPPPTSHLPMPPNLKSLVAYVVFPPCLRYHSSRPDPPEPWTLAESVDVAPVWSGHRVGFALLTDGDEQFAAYYDSDRRLTVASRKLDSTQWTYQVLPTSVKWDCHNYVTMAFDEAGQAPCERQHALRAAQSTSAPRGRAT